MTVMYHLVGRVVSLQLLVVGVLHKDGMIADEWSDGGVIIHHRLSSFLRVHLQKSLRSHNTLKNLTLSTNELSRETGRQDEQRERPNGETDGRTDPHTPGFWP